MAPDPSSQSPLPYERPGAEAIPGVFRDGGNLVVPRGADISRLCYRCGRPGAGATITKFLRAKRQSTGMHNAARRNSPLILDIIVAVLGTIVIVQHRVKDAGPRKKRKITFGFCDAHRRGRRLKKWLSLAAIPLGLAMFFAGVESKIDPHRWLAGLMVIIAGLGGGLTVLGFVGLALLAGPSLVKEGPDHLWIDGAGEMLVKAQAPLGK